MEWWRRAAVELLAGSHALDTTDHQPWLTEQGAAWYLMRDLATALEAVLILDDRLAEVGVLAKHDIPVPSLGLDTKRMLLGHVARVATWSATSDSPDQAFTRLRGDPVAHGPVVVVATPRDLAAAQRRLATFLRPSHASDAFYTGDPEITADTARMLVANQLFLTGSFAQLAERSPGPVKLAGAVRGPPRDPRGDHAPAAAPRRPPPGRRPGSTLVATDRDHHRRPAAAPRPR